MVTTPSDQKVSVHLAMKRNDFWEISNLNYDIIKNEITKMNYSEKIYCLVAQFILETLIAYDQNKRKELYNCII